MKNAAVEQELLEKVNEYEQRRKEEREIESSEMISHRNAQVEFSVFLKNFQFVYVAVCRVCRVVLVLLVCMCRAASLQNLSSKYCHFLLLPKEEF